MAGTEWNAETYHRVAEPQVDWGRGVLASLELEGSERAVDAGCGTGRLTGELLARLPAGRVLAIDRSQNMLGVAARELGRRFGPRVFFLRANLGRLALRPWADLVFSTATFHWVKDHPSLFRNLHDALAPGGRLIAQCGGGDNLALLLARAASLMGDPRFADHFRAFDPPWEFATDTMTAARLESAGFVDVETSLAFAPVTLPDRDAYREFLECVIVRPHLEYLPGDLRAAFLDDLTDEAGGDSPRFSLDYWRLNMRARKRAG
jgi:trans-aconitate methyltransferase